jgi:hypothetical protein
MNRRDFLLSLGTAAPSMFAAQQQPVPAKRPSQLTAGSKPAIAINHLGFLPKGGKRVIFRLTGPDTPAAFTMREIGSVTPAFSITRPLPREPSDLGECLVGDFSDVDRVGMYQITIGDQRSVPFFIRQDVWRRTLPKAFSFYPQKRCGIAVPNVHPVCHLDDGRRRDNGQYIDTTGGWHDAGDLRKWMTSALLSGAALSHLARNPGDQWNLDGSGLAPLLDEIKLGNRYWLKMQDSDGRVFNDVGGGVKGDNSDNHWTDNVIGNEDDRYINPAKPDLVQAQFTAVEASLVQVYRKTDPGYGQICLAAALRCWNANTPANVTVELGWWTLAALELYRATGEKRWAEQAAGLATRLLSLHNTDYTGGQKVVRGFWRTSEQNPTPLVHHYLPGIPAIALLELAHGMTAHPDVPKWREAVRRHVDDYVLPMASRNAYRIVPFGLFNGSPSQERYRSLGGELTYRYFMPVARGSHGLTSHFESYAAMLALAGRVFANRRYTELAYRQLEWVMGANPFGACLMTGEGMRNPYPHSRYESLTVGALMNGFGGNEEDEPLLDMEYGFDWHTTEYWQPHNAWYLWTHSVLEG